MSDYAIYPDLRVKVALVMGFGQAGPTNTATWGNGAAIARLLCRNQVNVFGCDWSSAAAEFTAQRIRAEGGTCDYLVADVTKRADVQKVVDAVMNRYGRINILINNVGNMAPGTPTTLSEDVWDQQLELNLKTVYLSCHLVLPIMREQKSGVVVNNASIAGLRYLGKPQIAYNTAKAAVIHFTSVTAAMYAAEGVRLNSVIPGFIYTPLVEKFSRSEVEAERRAYRSIVQHNIPIGRMGEADDVANACAFLASQSAKYITGHGIVVDGGLTCSIGI